MKTVTGITARPSMKPSRNLRITPPHAYDPGYIDDTPRQWSSAALGSDALRGRGRIRLRRHLLTHDALGIFAGAGTCLGHSVEAAREVDVLPRSVVAQAGCNLSDADGGDGVLGLRHVA